MAMRQLDDDGKLARLASLTGGMTMATRTRAVALHAPPPYATACATLRTILLAAALAGTVACAPGDEGETADPELADHLSPGQRNPVDRVPPGSQAGCTRVFRAQNLDWCVLGPDQGSIFVYYNRNHHDADGLEAYKAYVVTVDGSLSSCWDAWEGRHEWTWDRVSYRCKVYENSIPGFAVSGGEGRHLGTGLSVRTCPDGCNAGVGVGDTFIGSFDRWDPYATDYDGYPRGGQADFTPRRLVLDWASWAVAVPVDRRSNRVAVVRLDY
jgi:hypothetical protein